MGNQMVLAVKPCILDDITVDATMIVESPFSVIWVADGTWSEGKAFNAQHAEGLLSFLSLQLTEKQNSIVQLEAAYMSDKPIVARTIDLTNTFLWPTGTAFKDNQIASLLKHFGSRARSFNYPISIDSISFPDVDEQQTVHFISYLFRYANAKMRKIHDPSNKNGLRLTSSLRLVFKKPVLTVDDVIALKPDQYVESSTSRISDQENALKIRQHLIGMFSIDQRSESTTTTRELPFLRVSGDAFDVHFDLEPNAFTIVARNGRQNKDYLIGLDLAFTNWIIGQNRKIVAIESSHKDVLIDLIDIKFWPKTAKNDEMRRQIVERTNHASDYSYPISVDFGNSSFIQFLTRNVIGKLLAKENDSMSVNSTPSIRFVLDGSIDYDHESKSSLPDEQVVQPEVAQVVERIDHHMTRVNPAYKAEIDNQINNAPIQQLILWAGKWLESIAENGDQKKLRDELLRSCDACCLSTWEHFEVAHVKPRSHCEDVSERFDARNVIPLSPNLHAAFDENEFGIELDGSIMLSRKLSENRRLQLEYAMINRKIDVLRVDRRYLEYRLALFHAAEAS